MGGWVWKLAVQCWQISPQTHVLYLKWLFISLRACMSTCLHVCTSVTVCENGASATFGDSHHRRHMSCNGFLSDSMPIYLCMSARLHVKMGRRRLLAWDADYQLVSDCVSLLHTKIYNGKNTTPWWIVLNTTAHNEKTIPCQAAYLGIQYHT